MLIPLTAFRWFIEYGGRSGMMWENSITWIEPATPTPFHPGLCAPHLHAALLMMIASEDEMQCANSHIARKVFEAAPQPKELVEIEGGHFGIMYYPSPLFDQASKTRQDFLETNLQ